MFYKLVRANGNVDELVTNIKNNTLNTFANMPSNVYHWGGEEKGEKREFNPEVVSRYGGAPKAHRMAYNLLRHAAVKMPQLKVLRKDRLRGSVRRYVCFRCARVCRARGL
jgi:hypothetical protein